MNHPLLHPLQFFFGFVLVVLFLASFLVLIKPTIFSLVALFLGVYLIATAKGNNDDHEHHN